MFPLTLQHVALQIQLATLGMVNATKDTYPEHKVRRFTARDRADDGEHIPDKRF